MLYCCRRYVNNESMSCKSNRPKQLTANAVYNTIIHICYLEHTYKLISVNRICICVIYLSSYISALQLCLSFVCTTHCCFVIAVVEQLRCGINTLSNISNYVTYQYYSVYYINLRVFDNIFCMLQTPLVHCLSNFLYNQLLVCEISMTNIIIVFFHKHLYLNHLMTHIMIVYT